MDVAYGSGKGFPVPRLDMKSGLARPGHIAINVFQGPGDHHARMGFENGHVDNVIRLKNGSGNNQLKASLTAGLFHHPVRDGGKASFRGLQNASDFGDVARVAVDAARIVADPYFSIAVETATDQLSDQLRVSRITEFWN